MRELYYLVGQEDVHGFETISELLEYFYDDLKGMDESIIKLQIKKYVLCDVLTIEHDFLSDNYDYEVIDRGLIDD